MVRGSRVNSGFVAGAFIAFISVAAVPARAVEATGVAGEPESPAWTAARLSHGPVELASAPLSPLCGLVEGYGLATFWASFTDGKREWWRSAPIAYGVIGPFGALGGSIYGSALAPLAVADGTWDLFSLGATSERPFRFFGNGGDGKSPSAAYVCAGFFRALAGSE